MHADTTYVSLFSVEAFGAWCLSTVSFHNFKSQNFKLSVSNPKNKYVAYVSVLSQISNYQGLGRKNKHEILKADRSMLVVIVMLRRSSSSSSSDSSNSYADHNISSSNNLCSA